MRRFDLNNSENQLNILNQFSIDLINVTDKNELFWHVAREVVSKLGFVDCVLYELDVNSNSLIQRAAFGEKNPSEDIIVNPLIIAVGKGVTGFVAKTGEPVIIGNVTHDDRYISDVGDNRSEICVPIKYNNLVKGVIDCEDPRKNYFNSRHQRILSTVAAMLSSKLLQYDINFHLQSSNRALNQEIKKSRVAELALIEHRKQLESTVKKRTQQLQQSLVNLELETQEKLQAEEKLRKNQALLSQSAKMASIGLLAAGVAHEINNPVSFIQSNLEILSEYVTDFNRLIEVQSELVDATLDKQADVLDIANKIKKIELDIHLSEIRSDLDDLFNAVLQGTNRVTNIVADLKQFSHSNRETLVNTDINLLMDAALNITSNQLKNKAEIKRNYHDKVKVFCYPNKLEQVFINLLVNAAQAISNFGLISINTKRLRCSVEITITDTGIGMTKDVQEKIFEPFFTTKDVGVGTGLGLHIAYNIVESHGGKFQVESKTGCGTSITVCLPIKAVTGSTVKSDILKTTR